MICKLQSEQQPSEDWSQLGPAASEPVPARRALGIIPTTRTSRRGLRVGPTWPIRILTERYDVRRAG
jgi:hypothetical protein